MNNDILINSKKIGDKNLLNIFKLIHREKEISRVELAHKSSYSFGTISNHVKKLLDNDIVQEKEKGISTGGRKPINLTINSERFYIIAVKIGVTELGVYILNLKLNMKDKSKKTGVIPFSYEEAINFIESQIQELLIRNDIKSDKVLGAGISVPGLVKREKGVIAFAPNLQWKNKNIVSRIKSAYDLPVYLDNEAKMGALGEKNCNYHDVGSLVYISINEGIGCGIIINNQLFRGNGENAGEYGHVIIQNDGPQCHCGNYGCWETLASENFVVKQWKKLKDNKSSKDKDEIYEMALQGNEMAEKILKKTAENIGTGIANIVNGINPEYIIIGGGINKAKDIISPTVREWAEKKSLEIAFEKTVIEFSELGNKSEIFGIGHLIIDKCLMLE